MPLAAVEDEAIVEDGEVTEAGPRSKSTGGGGSSEPRLFSSSVTILDRLRLLMASSGSGCAPTEGNRPLLALLILRMDSGVDDSLQWTSDRYSMSGRAEGIQYVQQKVRQCERVLRTLPALYSDVRQKFLRQIAKNAAWRGLNVLIIGYKTNAACAASHLVTVASSAVSNGAPDFCSGGSPAYVMSPVCSLAS